MILIFAGELQERAKLMTVDIMPFGYLGVCPIL